MVLHDSQKISLRVQFAQVTLDKLSNALVFLFNVGKFQNRDQGIHVYLNAFYMWVFPMRIESISFPCKPTRVDESLEAARSTLAGASNTGTVGFDV